MLACPCAWGDGVAAPLGLCRSGGSDSGLRRLAVAATIAATRPAAVKAPPDIRRGAVLVDAFFSVNRLMPGQQSLHRPLRRYAAIPANLLVAGLAMLLLNRPVMAAAPVDLRCRVQWTADQPIRLAGSIELSDGRLSELQNLSMQADTTGAYRIAASGKRLDIAPRGATQRGGLEFRAQASPDAVLRFALHTSRPLPAQQPASDDPAPQEIRLGDLVNGAQTIELPGARLWVRQAPGDEIRAEWGRDSLVFWADEPVPLRLLARPATATAGDQLELRLLLRQARGGRILWQQQWPVTVEATGQLPWTEVPALAMPAIEGAYAFEISCVRPPRSGLTLLRGDEEVLARRTIEVVVLQRTEPPADDGKMQTVAEFHPLQRPWPVTRLLPTVAGVLPETAAPASSGPLGEEIHQGQPVAAIKPAGWYAQPLRIAAVDRPHVLTVRYPTGHPMRLGISVVQRDAAGKILPLATDGGLATDATIDASAEGPWAEYQMVFWPRTAACTVVLTNYDSSEPARFESLRVEAGPRWLSPAPPPAPVAGSTSHADGASVSEHSSGGASEPAPRLAALYLDKPLLAECFGDAGQVDPAAQMVLEDWTMFLKAGQRLVDYVRWAGFNAAIVTVSSEGGTLYPTSLFAPTPRFDTGSFSSRGHDPIRKDVLELLMRLFDRAGLQLVPAIELATPVPALEAALADASEPSGIALVDAVGRNYVDHPLPNHGLAPYYNPLDPRVQQVLEQAVTELAQRYGDHRSLAGIGLHLGPQTYAQLPDARWGRDQQTMARFAASLPAEQRAAAAAPAWVDGPGRPALVQWRATQMTDLMKRLAAATKNRKLLLLTADWLTPATAPREVGLDWQQLAQVAGVVPMRLVRESVFQDVVRQSDDARQNESRQWDRDLAAAESAGGLLFLPPSDLQVTQADTAPQAIQARPRWFAHGLPPAGLYRRQLTGLMDRFDPQVLAVGSWTPALGQEAALRQTLQTFAALPAMPMQEVTSAVDTASHVRLREARVGQQRILAAVNLAPWPVELEVTFAGPVSLRPLAAPATNAATSEQDASSAAEVRQPVAAWRTTLGAGQLAAVGVSGEANQVRLWSARPSGGADLVRNVSDRVQQLVSRIALLGYPRSYPALLNPGFEESAAGSMPGWLHAQHPPGSVRLDDVAAEGEKSVLLTCDGRSGSTTWMVSAPIQPPGTGRLAVSLQARALADGGPPPQLRLAIEGRRQGQPFRRSVVLTPPADGHWQSEPLWMEVPDLGSDDLQQVRLTVDLLSAGKVWIDDIKLYDFFLTDDERADLQSRTFLAVERMRRGDLTAAARLLDSLWGRYLMSLRIESAPPPVPPTAEPAESAPGIAERMRSWLPSPLRF